MLANQLQDTLAQIHDRARVNHPLKTSIPTAADILCFLHKTHNTRNAMDLAPVIPFAQNIPVLSGNILELHPGNGDVDFATRLNINFDKPLIEKIKAEYSILPSVDKNFSTFIRQEKNGFPYGIENIWIEYDAPFFNAPALFFDINRNKAFLPKSVYHNLQQLADLFGWCVNNSLLHFLEQVQQAGLYSVYYGLMFSRDTKSIRLTINGLRAKQLTGTLKCLGWKGNYDALEKLAANYLTQEQKLVVGVDFENGVEDRIGIEVFDNDIAAFIQTLCEAQYISKTHAELFSTWQQRIKLPPHLANALTELHKRPVSWLSTHVNHFKFVIDCNGTVAAKGYLYYCF